MKKIYLFFLLTLIFANLSFATKIFIYPEVTWLRYSNSYLGTNLVITSPVGFGAGVIIQEVFTDDFIKGIEFSIDGAFAQSSASGNWDVYDGLPIHFTDPISVNVSHIVGAAGLRYVLFDPDSGFRCYVGAEIQYQQTEEIFGGTGGYMIDGIAGLGFYSNRKTLISACFPIGIRLFNAVFVELRPSLQGHPQITTGASIPFQVAGDMRQPERKIEKKEKKPVVAEEAPKIEAAEDASLNPEDLPAEIDESGELTSKGDAEFKDGKYRIAVGYYEEALNLGPSASLYKKIGNCNYYLKKKKEAIAAYKEAVKLDPADAKLIKYIKILEKK
jgi:hypothetical protein